MPSGVPPTYKRAALNYLTSPQRRPRSYIQDVTADNWRQIEFREINLWAVARSDICVDCEVSLAGLEQDAAKYLDQIFLHYNRAAEQIERSLDYVRYFQPDTVIIAGG